jgi:acetolactate synthase small subunit
MPNEIRNLHVRTQAKLGAVDRILGALTHRGIIPTSFRCDALEHTTLNIHIEFTCDDDHNLIKLCKHLNQQVYILSVADTSVAPVIAPLGFTEQSLPKALIRLNVMASPA